MRFAPLNSDLNTSAIEERRSFPNSYLANRCVAYFVAVHFHSSLFPHFFTSLIGERWPHLNAHLNCWANDKMDGAKNKLDPFPNQHLNNRLNTSDIVDFLSYAVVFQEIEQINKSEVALEKKKTHRPVVHKCTLEVNPEFIMLCGRLSWQAKRKHRTDIKQKMIYLS